jgi:hypothetical protein
MNSQEILAQATELLTLHFRALNEGDLPTFRATCYLFPRVDGLPFDRWWQGMRALSPFEVHVQGRWVAKKVAYRHEPHRSCWLRVTATDRCGRRYDDNFVVWRLEHSGECKLACRIHWWLRVSDVRSAIEKGMEYGVRSWSKE